MLFDNNTRSEALLRIKTRIPVLEGRKHEKRRAKAGPAAEFKVASKVKSVSWFPSAPSHKGVPPLN